MKNIIFIAPHGTGKGTQCDLLKEKYHFAHLSTGNLFREKMSQDTPLAKELKDLTSELEIIKNKIKELEKLQETESNKEDIEFMFNLKEIVFEIDKKSKVVIKNIIFNQNEIENIGYMFRNDCFDLVFNIDERNIIMTNIKTKEETNEYVNNLRHYYHIKETTIEAPLFDISKYNQNDIIQIIPQEKKNKFEKNKIKILEIEG